MEKSFEWFSLESAISPTTAEKPVKLNGMKQVYGVLSNPSRSTEEFIAGAISSLGQADQNIMYVNSTLNALSDRLRIAAKVAQPINTAKSRGVEGFANVPYLNPWEYAIEGKVGAFFQKIWGAIVSIARKIIEAIVNFIRFIGNAIRSAAAKAAGRDYDKYLKHKAVIDRKVKEAKVDTSLQINSLPWKVDAKKLADLIQGASAQYLKATKASSQDEVVLAGVARSDLKIMTAEKDFSKVFGKIFGVTGLATGAGAVGGVLKGQGAAFGAAKVKVESFVKSMNAQIEDGVKLMGGAKSTSPKEVVTSALLKGSDVGKVNVGDIVKLAGKDFGVLSNEWFGANVNKILASMRQAEKQFTKYTQTLDAVAKRFDKVMETNRGSGVASLSQLTSSMAKARCSLNSFYTGLILELTTYALRFRKTCHIALKAYLKVGLGSKLESAATESLSPQSIESMFTF